jgi:hypothetical protein
VSHLSTTDALCDLHPWPLLAERGVAAEQILEGMQPLLALPVEIVLLTHGGPADRAALERAPATSSS